MPDIPTDDQLAAELDAGVDAEAVIENDLEPANDQEPAEPANDQEAAPTEADEEPADEPEADPAPGEPEVDAKALEAIERREAASRKKMEAEFAEREARFQEQFQAKVQELEARFPNELVETVQQLRQMGVVGSGGQPDWMRMAKIAYARAKAAEGDPRFADQAAQFEQTSAFKSEVEQAREEARKAREEFQQYLAEQRDRDWLNQAASLATDATPIIKKWVEADRDEAQMAIYNEALRLKREYGEVPKHEDVLQSLEKRRRSELSKLGIDVEALAKPKAEPKKQTQTAPKTPAAISRDLGTSTQTRSETRSLDEIERELILELDEGRAT